MDKQRLKSMLDRHEGNRLKPYRCPAGRLTIGRGWNLDAHPLPAYIASYLHIAGEITPAMSDRLLDISVDATLRQCWAIFPQFGGFSENRQLALADFIFNVGAGKALTFKKMLAAILAGDWPKAADELRDSAYWRQLGGDPAGTNDGREERPEEIARMLREG